jgi:hypothetical protein
MNGYLLLCGLFVLMVLGCFGFALSELLRPHDPGPLPIDVTRDIHDRHFARTLWRTPAPLRVLLDPRGDPMPAAPMRLADGAAVSDGDAFLVHGDGRVLPGARVRTFVCNGTATLQDGAVVDEHAEGFSTLVVGRGACVGGRATSGELIWLAEGARVRFASAPEIRAAGGATVQRARLAPWDERLDGDLEWLIKGGVPIDVAVNDVAVIAGRGVDFVEGLRRFEALHWRPDAAIDLAEALSPTWLATKGWYIGCATARIRGDLSLPDEAVVPFALIVDGTLTAGARCRFLGGVHAGGDVMLAEDCVVEASLTAGGTVALGARCVVGECLSSGNDLFIGEGSLVGSPEGGGATSGAGMLLSPGVIVRNRIYADQMVEATGHLRVFDTR